MAQREGKTWIIVALIALLTLVGVGFWWSQRDGESNDEAQANGKTEVERGEALQREHERRTERRKLERVAVGGRVTRANDGTGIAGAVVLLSRKDIIQGQSPTPGEPTIPLTATTDENGGWELPGVDPGHYMISATAVGFIPAVDDDVRISGANDQPINLSLSAGGALLSGTITDIGGGPIEGVLVRASDSSQINLGFNQAPLAAITNEDGEYRLQVAIGRYGIGTFHPDYVAEARATDVPEGGRREDFKLVPGGTIEGVVLARPEGDPVAGARVTFSDSRAGDFGGGINTNISLDGSVVVTDEEGRFRITGVRAGVVTLTARASGHASVTPEEVPIGIGEQVTGIELWVDTAYSISGFVVPKGEPGGAIEGVLVGAWQMQPFGLLVANAPTASDGYFEIVGVPVGNWQVGALSEDHLVSLTGATAIIEDHDVKDLTIELEGGIYVRGRVDPGSRARVRVELNPDNVSLGNLGGTIGDALASTVSDETGAFELGPLGPGTGFGGRELKIVAESDAGFRGETTVQLRREDLEGVVISMEKGANVSGTVLDENGVPQSGVIVSVTPVEPKPGAGMMSFRGPRGDGAPTNEDGRFAVRGLELGKHHLIIKDGKGRPMSWAPGSGPPQTDDDEVAPLEIAIEDTVNEQFFDLRVVPRDAEITGVVLDAEGLPVADAWVRASLEIDGSQMFRQLGRDKTEHKTGVVPEDEDAPDSRDFTRSAYYSEPPVLTDQNGLFVIKDLRRDRNYHLIAEGERGGARATLDSVAPNSRVTLNLEMLSGIDGVVTLDGKPVTDYRVRLVGPVNRDKRIAHPKGQFRLDRLDPGKYEVQVKADAGTGEAKVELGEAARASVKVELEPSGSLRGRVVGDKDGEPMPGLRIMVMSERGGFDAGAGLGMLTGQGPQTDRDGRFEITGVAPGKGTLSFVDPDVGLSGSVDVAELEYELEPGADEDLGTIKGMQGDKVARDERGTLQMRTRRATWAKRPRPPDTDLDAEEPDPEAEADQSSRLWVYSVELGGVAEQAGVAPGDEIISIDGQSVASVGAPMAASKLSTSRLRVNQDVRLELARDGDRFDVTIKAVAEAL